MGAEFFEAPDVRSGRPAVGDVADQRDRKPLEPALALANRHDVQQALRRMFVRAVAGVNHAALEILGQKVRSAGRVMPDDD